MGAVNLHPLADHSGGGTAARRAGAGPLATSDDLRITRSMDIGVVEDERTRERECKGGLTLVEGSAGISVAGAVPNRAEATTPSRTLSSAAPGTPAFGAARSLLPRRVVPPLWREARAAGLLLSMLRGGLAPPQPDPVSSGAPVLLVPGLFAGDDSLEPLANALDDHGWAVWPSSIRSNVGCSGTMVRQLVTRIEAIAAHRGGRVALVGHSRGGLLARAAAQRRPDLVSGVVTLGSPHRDQLAVHPVLWANLVTLAALGSLGVPGLMRFGCRGTRECCRGFDHDVWAPLPASIGAVSLFSRRDGVVDWRACLDPHGSNVEIRATHCGMPSDPAALRAILRAVEGFQSSPELERIAA
ncbi:MAG: triacylglycerol lipase [Solirubrobacteraceae bacterium]|nr:triacylglycerol lipase [Solirubrobacteraceae bacterium]